MAYSFFDSETMYIFFDLDDTLFEEREFCRSAYREVVATIVERYPLDSIIRQRLEEGMWQTLCRRENPFSWLESELKDSGMEYDIKSLVEVYRRHQPISLPLNQDVRPALEALRKRGDIIGLITDGRSLTQRNKIRALGLDELFPPELILISEETGYDKRSSEPFRKAMELCGVITKEGGSAEVNGFAYIGDNTAKDFLHPNLLGWDTICLRHKHPGIHPQDFNKQWPEAPHCLINTISDLLTH